MLFFARIPLVCCPLKEIQIPADQVDLALGLNHILQPNVARSSARLSSYRVRLLFFLVTFMWPFYSVPCMPKPANMDLLMSHGQKVTVIPPKQSSVYVYDGTIFILFADVPYIKHCFTQSTNSRHHQLQIPRAGLKYTLLLSRFLHQY